MRLSAPIALISLAAAFAPLMQQESPDGADTGSEMGLWTDSDGSSVTIGEGTHHADHSGSGTSGSAPEPQDSSGGVPGGSAPAEGGDGLGGNPREIVDVLVPCPGVGECTDTDPAVDAITLRDLVNFSPTEATIRMEPDGWMVAGRPANFIAETAAGATATGSTAEQTVGTLLGRPIAVRFTPVSYNWSWGDGSADTVTTPGRTWEDLGLPRFSETATSHVFTERGTVTVSLSVSYVVDYALSRGAWTRVSGTVATAATVDAYVGTAKTVLVDGTCVEYPGDPGC